MIQNGYVNDYGWRRDVQLLQQPDPDQLHVHEQLGRITVGGGMYNCSSSPILTDCTFTNNSADYGAAGCSTSPAARP